MLLPPFQRFHEWFEHASHSQLVKDATAMCLATTDRARIVSARMVLLKHWDERGFCFFTNKNSHKSLDLEENARAALCFYWEELGRQVRIQGAVEETSDAESDAYFAKRPRESQIGAWASQQSSAMQDAGDLQRAFDATVAKFEGQGIPRPPHWGGWRIIPERMEFWQEGAHRLHNRELFTLLNDGVWQTQRLYP